MANDFDALIVGAGPAGSATAILLAQAGWRVVLVEQNCYPRRKVCGECIAPGGLALLDALGVGDAVSQVTGPALRQVAWVNGARTVRAELPACEEGRHRYGRALGRDRLDSLLLERARSLGVTVLQPVKVTRVHGAIGKLTCELQSRSRSGLETAQEDEQTFTVTTTILVDAHGSWERFGEASSIDVGQAAYTRRGKSKLLAFKANFNGTSLTRGLLPVLAFRGGYGGMVVADHHRTTLACCVRSDTLRIWRDAAADDRAGDVVERNLRRMCRFVDEALEGASREGEWLAVGPIRPGIRVLGRHSAFPVGNAAGESHPLIGEGIGMALQSAVILTDMLKQHSSDASDGPPGPEVQRKYAAAWRSAFASRVRLAGLYARFAMHPALSSVSTALMNYYPRLLTDAARLAGKASRGICPFPFTEETHEHS